MKAQAIYRILLLSLMLGSDSWRNGQRVYQSTSVLEKKGRNKDGKL
jgi:hypothetical protein